MVNTLQFFCLVLGLSLTAGPVEQSALSEVIGSSSAASEASETDADVQKIPDIEAGILDITKYGNITLTIGPDSMEDLGYEPADLILVRIGDSEMEMPIGTAYTDADSGAPSAVLKVV